MASALLVGTTEAHACSQICNLVPRVSRGACWEAHCGVRQQHPFPHSFLAVKGYC